MLASPHAHGKAAIAPDQPGVAEGITIVGKAYPTNAYTDCLVRFPTILTAFYTFVPLILTILSLTFTPETHTDDTALQIRDHSSAQQLSVYRDTTKAWVAELEGVRQRAAADMTRQRSQLRTRIEVIFYVDRERVERQMNTFGGNLPPRILAMSTNVLEREGVVEMHQIEERISRLDQFGLLCWNPHFRGAVQDYADVTYQSDFPNCAPLTSLMTYYYPGTLRNISGESYWDLSGGTGVLQEPLDSVQEIIFRNPRYRWFVDQAFSKLNRRTTQVRSQIQLGTPVINVQGSTESDEEVSRLMQRFVEAFIDLMGKYRSHPVYGVTFGGDGVKGSLVRSALNRDTSYLAISAVFLLLVFWYHFHSFVLAVLGLLQIAITYPTGLFIYLAATKKREVSMFTTMAFFVTLIIATDALLIFFDTFRHSGFMCTSGRRNLLSVSQRIAYTYRKAGAGITIASLILLVVFAVNTTSPIPIVADFAVIMTILVVINWTLTLTMFPACVLFHHFHISKRRRNLQRQKDILLARGKRRRDPNITMFLVQLEELNAKLGVPCFADTRRFMDCELATELLQRQPEGIEAIWDRLGIGNPVRVVSPFSRHGDVGDAPLARDEGETVDAQAFLDQFPDQAPTTGQAESVKFDRYVPDLASTFHIRNINCDELLGFDDARLRFKLMETGARLPSEFRQDQLEALAPDMGIDSQGTKADARIAGVVRLCMFLMYGGARSLHKPSIKKRKETRPPNEQTAAAAGEVEAASPNGSVSAAPPPRNSRFGFSKKLSDWWQDRRSVRREWCCGMFGKRVGETKAEEEARIMAKKIKHEGYTKVELLFHNAWAPLVFKARFPLAIVALIWLVICSIFAAQLQPAREAPDLLGPTDPTRKYEELRKKFGDQGNCDYCSAFFRSYSDFPRPSEDTIRRCAETAVEGQQMFSYLDECGVCNGNNACRLPWFFWWKSCYRRVRHLQVTD